GADAIYLGGPQLQLRADKSGFTMEDLIKAGETVHAKGKKLYVTVNCFAKNSEIGTLGDYAKSLYDIGIDAVIVSDIGAIETIKKSVPELEVHVSTQANCQNYAAANVYYNMGASRVVLGREMTLDEIGELRAKTPKELTIETFVHGAMCMSYSGRCLISSFLNNRSGNRGECTQPCRWKYYLMEEKRPGVYLPVFEDEKGSSVLSSHDLCCIDFLDQIIGAGVESFKIEGRMKTAYYVATVVNAYRRRLDGTSSPDYCRKELECVTHRPYSSGFYFGYEKSNPNNHGEYIKNCTFTGTVLDCRGGYLTVQQRNNFKVGETLEVLTPGREAYSFEVCEIIDENGDSLSAAPHPMMTVKIPCEMKAGQGDILRRKESGYYEQV
ncbi:MAG: U32 family peptidase, partial [Oscillospiraceae bacterium]|nr:U32 family peptidase [Oscillospiraceae bacterium]